MTQTAHNVVQITAVLLLATSQAYAAKSAPFTNADTLSTTVHFRDLNLDHPADVVTLYRRLSIAAKRDCGEPSLTGSHVISPSWQKCVSQAIDQAVRVVDRPSLSVYHRAQTKQSDESRTVARR